MYYAKNLNNHTDLKRDVYMIGGVCAVLIIFFISLLLIRGSFVQTRAGVKGIFDKNKSLYSNIHSVQVGKGVVIP